MAETQEKITITLSGRDDATAVFKSLAEGLDRADRETRELAQGQERAATTSERLAARLQSITSGLALMAGARKAVDLLGDLAGKGREALEAWREQDQVNRDLADSLARAGVAQDKLNDEVARYSAIAGEAAGRTMFGDEDVFRGISRYVQLTGQANVSTTQLNTILGIAHKEQVSTAKAAEMYAKAVKGNLGQLAKYTTATRDQARALDQIADPAERARRAEALLTETFAGVADQISPTFNQIKNLEDAQGDLAQAIGGVIDQSGVVAAILPVLTAQYREVEAAVGGNAQASQLLAVSVAKGVVGALQDAMPWLQSGVSAANALGTGLKLTYLGAKNAGEGVLWLGNQLLGWVTDKVSVVLATMEGLAAKGAELARTIGQDEVADQIDRLRGKLSGYKADLEGIKGDAFKRAAASAKELGANVDEGADTLLRYNEREALIGKGFGKANELLVKMNTNLDGARERIIKLGGASPLNTKTLRAGAAVDGVQDKREVERVRLEKQRQVLAAARIRVLDEEDKRKRALLEKEAALLEIKQQGLTGDRKYLAVLQAEQAYKTTIAELDKADREQSASSRAALTRLAALQAGNEAARVELEFAAKRIEIQGREMTQAERLLALEELRREQVQARGELTVQLVEREAQALEGVAAQMDQLGASAGTSASASAGAYAALARTIAALRQDAAKLQAGLVTGGQAVQSGLASVTAGATALYGALGGEVGDIALLQGALTQAQAIAAFALGNPIQGVALQGAAVAYFATAAQAGRGGGGGGAGVSGATAGGAPSRLDATGPSAPALEDIQRRTAQINAEELARVFGDRASVTLNFDQRNSLLESDPGSQRRLARMVQSATRRDAVVFERGPVFS